MKYLFFPCVTGVRCQSKSRYVTVAVDERGAKRLKSGKLKNKVIFWNIPLLRGICYFFCGAIALLKGCYDCLNLSGSKLEGKVTEKVGQKLNVRGEGIALTFVLLFSLALSLILFGFLPAKLSFLFIGMSMNFFLRNFIIAVTKIVIFFLILLIFRYLPAMQDLYKFNGATNQVALREDRMKKLDDKDYYCPLNILNVIVFALILSIFVITLVGISIAPYWNFLINLGIFLVCIAVSFEICYIFQKSYATRMVCLLTNFFVCVKPSITHDEVARVALAEIKSTNSEEDMKQDKSVLRSTLIAEMETELQKADRYDKADIDWIIATVLGCSREEAKLVRSFDNKTYREIKKATTARAQGKPLSAIFGFAEFYGLRFMVNKKVLAPRPETEILVEEVIKEIGDKKNLRVLDVGTGSGAIAVSIAKNSKAKVTALDISKSALEIAKTNAKKNNVKVEFILSNLFDSLKRRARFDIIVSNPPYIRTLDIQGLDDEVKNYDPKIALDGGEDGLNFYRLIAERAPNYLTKGGQLFLEIGMGQFKNVQNILESAGFSDITFKKDYSNIVRVVRAVYGKRRRNIK